VGINPARTPSCKTLPTRRKKDSNNNDKEKWFEIKPEIFLQNPLQFKNKVLSLQIITSCQQQPCET